MRPPARRRTGAIGPGAFVTGRRASTSGEKRPLTSPPQWPAIRTRGARSNSSGPSRGVLQVVTSASTRARRRQSASPKLGAPIRSQAKLRARRRCRVASKKDGNSSALHSTASLGLRAISDHLDQRPARGRGVAEQRDHDDRPEQRHDAGRDQDRLEGEAVCDRADQVGRRDRPEPRARARQAGRPSRRPGCGTGRRAATEPWSRTQHTRMWRPRNRQRARESSTGRPRGPGPGRRGRRPRSAPCVRARLPSRAGSGGSRSRRRRSCRDRQPGTGPRSPPPSPRDESPSRPGRSRTSR